MRLWNASLCVSGSDVHAPRGPAGVGGRGEEVDGRRLYAWFVINHEDRLGVDVLKTTAKFCSI